MDHREKRETGSLEAGIGGEAEKPEAIGLVSEVESVQVNPEGESSHRHARAKMARKERENQTSMKKKVNGKAPKKRGCAGSKSEKKSDSGGRRIF